MLNPQGGEAAEGIAGAAGGVATRAVAARVPGSAGGGGAAGGNPLGNIEQTIAREINNSLTGSSSRMRRIPQELCIRKIIAAVVVATVDRSVQLSDESIREMIMEKWTREYNKTLRDAERNYVVEVFKFYGIDTSVLLEKKELIISVIFQCIQDKIEKESRFISWVPIFHLAVALRMDLVFMETLYKHEHITQREKEILFSKAPKPYLSGLGKEELPFFERINLFGQAAEQYNNVEVLEWLFAKAIELNVLLFDVHLQGALITTAENDDLAGFDCIIKFAEYYKISFEKMLFQPELMTSICKNGRLSIFKRVMHYYNKSCNFTVKQPLLKWHLDFFSIAIENGHVELAITLLKMFSEDKAMKEDMRQENNLLSMDHPGTSKITSLLYDALLDNDNITVNAILDYLQNELSFEKTRFYLLLARVLMVAVQSPSLTAEHLSNLIKNLLEISGIDKSEIGRAFSLSIGDNFFVIPGQHFQLLSLINISSSLNRLKDKNIAEKIKTLILSKGDVDLREKLLILIKQILFRADLDDIYYVIYNIVCKIEKVSDALFDAIIQMVIEHTRQRPEACNRQALYNFLSMVIYRAGRSGDAVHVKKLLLSVFSLLPPEEVVSIIQGVDRNAQQNRDPQGQEKRVTPECKKIIEACKEKLDRRTVLSKMGPNVEWVEYKEEGQKFVRFIDLQGYDNEREAEELIKEKIWRLFSNKEPEPINGYYYCESRMVCFSTATNRNTSKHHVVVEFSPGCNFNQVLTYMMKVEQERCHSRVTAGGAAGQPGLFVPPSQGGGPAEAAEEDALHLGPSR